MTGQGTGCDRLDRMTDRSAARWKVTTWNLHGSARPDIAAVAAAVAAIGPDVLSAQEVRRRQARRLARQLGWHLVWARKHHPYTPLLWWRTEGIAVVTPHPVSHVVRTTISHGASTWTHRHRVLLAVTVTRNDAAIRVYDTHLAAHDTDARITQARRVAEHVVADAAPVPVVAGDLNTHHHDEVEILRELRAAGLEDAGGDSTGPAHAPQQRLDRVLVPASAVVLSSDTPDGDHTWAALSDHLPATVTFEA